MTTTRAQKRTIDELFGGEVIEIIEDVENRPKRIKSSVPLILDGRFFEIVSNDDGKIRAKCTECSEMKKGHMSSSANFKSHYRLVHPNTFPKSNDYLEKKTNEHKATEKLQQTLDHFVLNPSKVIYFVLSLYK